MPNWYDYSPIGDFGKQFSFATYPVQGEDIPMPMNTPITALFSGTIANEYYDAGGGQVVIRANDPNQLGGIPYYYYVHLDQYAPLAIGTPVQAGELIGYSGGQNVGGTHPAAPNYSSGPHLEFGLSKSASIPYTLATITPDLNPNAVLAKARGAQLPTSGSAFGAMSTDCKNCPIGFYPLAGRCFNALANKWLDCPATPADPVRAIADFLQSLSGWISDPTRIIKLVVGIVLIGGAIFLMANPTLQTVGGVAKQLQIKNPLKVKPPPKIKAPKGAK